MVNSSREHLQRSPHTEQPTGLRSQQVSSEGNTEMVFVSISSTTESLQQVIFHKNVTAFENLHTADKLLKKCNPFRKGNQGYF